MNLRRQPKPMTHVLGALCKEPWAITESALAQILEIAQLSRDERESRIEALSAKLGQPLDYTHAVSTRDGVAIIPVEGPLFRYSNLMTQFSGATSTADLATDLRATLDDPAVQAIVLEIDSPGGEVSGTSEFAQMLYDARGTKPIVAYVQDMGCSAAYWIASACDEIVMADTAIVGSIGCVAALRDPKADKSGRIEFVSSQSPNKRVDPTTKDGAAQIQGMVDDLAAVFVETVARNRGIDADTVLADFGQGGVMVGQKAVDAGLADRVATYEALHTQLTTPHSSHPLSSRSMTHEGPDTAAPAASLPLEDTVNESIPATDAAETVNSSEYVVGVSETDAAAGEEAAVILGSAPVADRTAELEARIAALEADNVEQAARAAAAQEALRVAESEREHEMLRALAADWFGDTEKHVGILQQLTPEARAFYEETQRAHAEHLRTESVILKPVGVSNPQPEASEGFEKRLDAQVTKIRQDNPKTSRAAAMRQAMRQDPELAAEYERSQRPSA